MNATLEQLVSVRSQFVEDVMDYLTRLANELDQTSWMRGGQRIKASDIAVEPFVLTMQERPRASRMRQECDGLEASMEKRSLMEEIEAQRYELPVKMEKREELRWRQVLRRGHVRLGMKGAPGSGKTFTTRQTVAALAREALAKLERQVASTEAVEVPLWVTAKALAQAGASGIKDALLQAIENSLGVRLSPNVRSWMKRAISSSRALIVVDALDELLEGDHAAFAAKAKQLDELSARVVVTCRTMQWAERKSWLGWHQITEVELAPFKRMQQREFTGKFFEGSSHLAQSTERLLQVNYALRHACTTPLLMTFVSLLHEEGAVNEGTSYAGLYGRMLRKVTSGEWRGVRPMWTGSGVKEERRLHELEGIVWRIFSRAPQLNRFTLADWERSANGVGAVDQINPADLLEQMEQVGLIMPAGFDEKSDRCWSFVHRTFLEFLAARALSRMDRQVWISEARKHLWFAPEWLEVLTFVAGLAGDATPLIKAVEEEKDDLFGSMLYLKARLVGAATTVDEQVVRRVGDEVFSFWQEALTLDGSHYHLRPLALRMLTMLAMHEKARRPLIEGVLEVTMDEDWYVRMAVAEALGSIGTEQAVERLLELTKNVIEGVNDAAAEALGSIGAEQAAQRLLELMKDGNWYVRL